MAKNKRTEKKRKSANRGSILIGKYVQIGVCITPFPLRAQFKIASPSGFTVSPAPTVQARCQDARTFLCLTKHVRCFKELTLDDVNEVHMEARAPPRGRSSAPYALAWPVAAAPSAWEDRQTVRISLLENRAPAKRRNKQRRKKQRRPAKRF